MTTKEALINLINNSNLVQEQKDLFLNSIDSITEKEMVQLGKVLVDQRRTEAEKAKLAAIQLDELKGMNSPIEN